ncbi:MAG: glycine cleavage system aminomethyltransferase GcvT [Verrucomicrobiales bacterium]|nr:glycine cleavage system aminomethyltransferase GcvT [Verrucomicrobiales bacterium]
MSEPSGPLHLSPLHAAHAALGARMVPFAGWEMPVQYSGLLAEHAAVRGAVGLFDISHMGQVLVSGQQAADFLNHVLTNNAAHLQPGQGHYTLMLLPSGGVLDDLIAYRASEREFLLVINAAREAEDWRHLADEADLWRQREDGEDLRLSRLSDQCAGMAIQGPRSRRVFHRVFGEQAPWPERNTLLVSLSETGPLWLCGTGYTGEEGFEFFPPTATAPAWWDRLLEAVTEEGGLPCGLGARDTLRLEMGYPLNGNDLSLEHTPLEAGLGFFVDLEKPSFIGQQALVEQKSCGLPSRLTGIELIGTAPPPRPHYTVWKGDQPLGELSSGTLSPSLRRGIAMAYLPTAFSKPGTELEIDIRGRRYPARTVKKPFYHPQPPPSQP